MTGRTRSNRSTNNRSTNLVLNCSNFIILQSLIRNSFFLLLLFFFSCGEESIELGWTEQISPTDQRLTSVFFTDDQTGHIVGGDSWYSGIYLTTQNGGDTWLTDTIDQSLLYSIDFTKEGKGHTVGISGIYQKPHLNALWARQGLSLSRTLPPLNDVAFYAADNGIIVGGIGYRSGVILRLGEDYKILSLDTFPQEIYSVTYTSEDIVHAAGYGLLLRSEDSGLNWEILPIDSDAYRSLHFPSEQVGYGVGYSGTIIKTTDGGKTWFKQRDGNKFLVSDKPFRAVFFTDEEKGYIVGDDGLFWRTNDGGDHWKEVADFPDVNLLGVFMINNVGYIVGDGGRIFQFVD